MALIGDCYGVAGGAAGTAPLPRRRSSALQVELRIRWSKADRLALAPSPMAMTICL
jgi:hypothetical protein